MKAGKVKGYLLVVVQFICLGGIVISGRLLASHPLLMVLQAAGLALGIWSVAVMGIGNFNITPDIKKEAHLVTHGPYRLIRHPMYSALLFIIWPLIIDQFSLRRFTIGLILTVNLTVKMLYEEILLRKNFTEYETYIKRTKRLIPFII